MKWTFVFILLAIVSCKPQEATHPEQLLRVAYHSECSNSERDLFLYLPKGYRPESTDKWPVIVFLNGDGERGNGQDELDYLLKNGPLYEAWIQKKDLPFIIVAPQLPMFGIDTLPGNEWLKNRSRNEIPERLENSTPPRPEKFGTVGPMQPVTMVENFDTIADESSIGWNRCESDVTAILEMVLKNYHADRNRVYLTGLSRGGYGTWFIASRHPDAFAAISPVVGWGYPEDMAPLAKVNMPVWCFAGGRDQAVELKYFYAGMNRLEELGNTNFRFTIEEDMNHDVWNRVYSGDDIYNWFLQYSLEKK